MNDVARRHWNWLGHGDAKMLRAKVFAVAAAAVCLAVMVARSEAQDEGSVTEERQLLVREELKAWLQNMVWYHRFTVPEIQAATGLREQEIRDALREFDIEEGTRPARAEGAPLLVLPYPGGRHPRIGFLEGAIDPQRDTKISVFTPWDENSYVVLDVPEAIWSDLGLTYLAHTHIPTIWTKENISLPRVEWRVGENGVLESERVMPNGIAFGTKVIPKADSVWMEMWLRNGTPLPLTDLRVQNCAMLKGAAGFNQQTNSNKVFRSPYAACHDEEKQRWIIMAWVPVHRVWGNPPVPCLHSDPKFPDCGPGETQRVYGWFSFYEGEDIQAEFDRIEATGWRKGIE